MSRLETFALLCTLWGDYCDPAPEWQAPVGSWAPEPCGVQSANGTTRPCKRAKHEEEKRGAE